MLGIVKTVHQLHVYLLADPRLAEALDYSTIVPLTGSVCSAPKPLPNSNHLHSQHLNNDQHEDCKAETKGNGGDLHQAKMETGDNTEAKIKTETEGGKNLQVETRTGGKGRGRR